MNNRTDRLAVEFILVALAQAAMLVGGLVTIKLLSNLLSKPEFAIYSLLFSVASFLVAAFFGPLGQINMRFLVLAQQEGGVAGFFAKRRRLSLAISVTCVLVSGVAAILLRGYIGNIAGAFVALVLLTLAMGYQSSQQFALMAFRLRREGSISQMIGALARPLLAFATMALFGYSALSATFGLAFGFAILSASQFVFLLRPTSEAKRVASRDRAQIAPDGAGLGRYVSYGAFFALQGASSAVVLTSDRWLLSAMGTLEQVAILSALMHVALAVVAFGFAVLTRFAAPIYFGTGNRPKDVQDRHLRILLLLWGGLCAAILALCALFHFEIVLAITNRSFAAYSHLLPWMVLGLALERTAQVLEMKGGLKLATKIYLYPRLLIIAMVPLSEYVFLRVFGFEGLVFGLVAATSAGLCMIIAVNHFRLR